MAIFIDDEAVTLEAGEVGGALDAAQERLKREGRVIAEVWLEGQVLTGEALTERRSEAVGASELRLYSAEPISLALETLEQMRGRLGEAKTVQQEAADLLQGDQAGEAMAKMSEMVDIWLQTQQAVTMSAELAQVDLTDLLVNGRPVSAVTQELINALEKLRTLIEHSDTIALADALAYEWPPLVDRWDRLMEKLIQEIGGGST